MPRIRILPAQHLAPSPSPPDRRQSLPAAISYRYYTTYGLKIGSQLDLPELESLPQETKPDIRIQVGELADRLEGAEVSTPWLQCSSNRCQFLLDHIARYRVEQGSSIRVDRRLKLACGSTTEESDLRVYLLGSALGALLHQRHWLPLHISAVQTPAGVWGFTGDSGAGKSTLAAWLHYRYGWKIVSDDVGVIKPQEARPTLYPGPPRLKLWKDTLKCLGIDCQGLDRDLTRTEKFHLNHHKGFTRQTEPLKALVMLERVPPGEKASIEEAEGVEAFRIVMSALYLPEWGQRFDGPARLMRYGSDLAQRIQVYRYRRPWSLERVDESLTPLIQHIHDGVGHASRTHLT
ncbi:hypothetical protein QLQ86_13570 [Halomonas sp. LR5S13]|uniref:hypothetical protein n=1 Tax=Halomonas rhizosphaerae TaxID=3043296 RepID=UPI0024A9821D|nr:hypothetical protein [Halomonas rhizosphaerae]MDI5921822.1 hypothetical protein [Halomonas rhizosphaerae]